MWISYFWSWGVVKDSDDDGDDDDGYVDDDDDDDDYAGSDT